MIITSTAGVTGSFDPTVQHNFAFLDAELRYLGNDVLLNLTYREPSAPDFTTVATTPNQHAAAGAFNGFDPASPVYTHLASTYATGAQTAFATASGEVHASGQHVIDETFSMFQSSLGGAAPGGQTAPIVPGSEPGTAVGTLLSTGPEDGWTRHYAWLRPVGGRGVVFADGNAGQLDWWAGGLALGYEGQARLGGGDARFGLGLGYLVNGASLPSRLSTLEGQGIHGGIYGGWSDGAMSLSGSLAYGAHHISTSRDTVIGALTETAKADYWAQSIGIDIEGSYGFALTNTVSIAPVGTLRAAWSGHNGVTETGAGALNATIDPAGLLAIGRGARDRTSL